jgi:hypothetical protein
MQQELALDEMISRYILGANQSAASLFDQDQYGFFLVVVYSAIDTLGLLNAPPEQIEATGESFKAWVNEFLIPNASGEYSADDLWGARCGVLHTFSTESRLSRQGKVRQLQYYLGSSETTQQFVEITSQMENGAHSAVHLGELGKSFFAASLQFQFALVSKCAASTAHTKRVTDVLQIYPM